MEIAERAAGKVTVLILKGDLKLGDGGSIKLLNLTKRVRDLLAITKLLTVFDTFDTEKEALGSFSG
jgi:anti-anti-sigma regulatory factor